MRYLLILAVFALTACGSTSTISTAATPDTGFATSPPMIATERPTALPPTNRPTIPAATAPSTAKPTALPLLDSISLAHLSEGWDVISPRLADPALQPIGESSPATTFAKDLPFKVEGIMLVSHIEAPAASLADGDVYGILYSRTDHTQRFIPLVIARPKPGAAGTFLILVVKQDPANVIDRTEIPAGLKMVISR